jgi:N-terminal conserved domain of Nudc./CS domain
MLEQPLTSVKKTLPDPLPSLCVRALRSQPYSMADRFDDVLMTMAGQLGGIEPLLKTFFSFLHRNTDFYVAWPPAAAAEKPTMGFATGKAEELLLKAFRSFPCKAYQSKQPVQTTASTAAAAAVGKASKTKQKSKTAAQPAGAALTSSLPAATAVAPATTAIRAQDLTNSTQSSASTAVSSKAQSDKSSAAVSSGTKQEPIGNGGMCTEHGYHWTQTLQEVTVYVEVPKGTRGRDVDCQIGAKTLDLQLRGTPQQVCCPLQIILANFRQVCYCIWFVCLH